MIVYVGQAGSDKNYLLIEDFISSKSKSLFLCDKSSFEKYEELIGFLDTGKTIQSFEIAFTDFNKFFEIVDSFCGFYESIFISESGYYLKKNENVEKLIELERDNRININICHQISKSLTEESYIKDILSLDQLEKLKELECVKIKI